MVGNPFRLSTLRTYQGHPPRYCDGAGNLSPAFADNTTAQPAKAQPLLPDRRAGLDYDNVRLFMRFVKGS
jgi:hypothetical protein